MIFGSFKILLLNLRCIHFKMVLLKVLSCIRNILTYEDPQRKKEEVMTVAEMMYRQQGQDALHTALNILKSGPWTMEESSQDGIIVYSNVLPGSRKVFKIMATLDFPPQQILKEIFHNVEHGAEWNPSLKQVIRLKWVDEYTDIVYQQTSSQLGGLVSSREFVSLRRWEKQQEEYVTGIVSVEYPDAPRSENIRGWNGPGCWVIRGIPGEKDRSQITWLVNTNLRGWLPQWTVDCAFIGFATSYIQLLSERCGSLSSENNIT